MMNELIELIIDDVVDVTPAQPEKLPPSPVIRSMPLPRSPTGTSVTSQVLGGT